MKRLHGHYRWAASAGLAVMVFAVPFLGVPRTLAWLLFSVGALLLIAAALLFVAELRQKTPGPPMVGLASSHSREELISYLKAEQGKAAPFATRIAAGLSGSEYREVRIEVDAWATAISRHLREYEQELAKVFNEDERHYPTTEPQTFLDRRLQQLGKVIAVLEGRRDFPGELRAHRLHATARTDMNRLIRRKADEARERSDRNKSALIRELEHRPDCPASEDSVKFWNRVLLDGTEIPTVQCLHCGRMAEQRVPKLNLAVESAQGVIWFPLNPDEPEVGRLFWIHDVVIVNRGQERVSLMPSLAVELVHGGYAVVDQKATVIVPPGFASSDRLQQGPLAIEPQHSLRGDLGFPLVVIEEKTLFGGDFEAMVKRVPPGHAVAYLVLRDLVSGDEIAHEVTFRNKSSDSLSLEELRSRKSRATP